MTETVVYPAHTIVTGDPGQPHAEAVAVRDGRILAVGTLDECAAWGDHRVDGTFAEQVLVPGMIEAHAHTLAGAFALVPYAGWFDRAAPDGSTVPGIRSYTTLIEHLRALDAEIADPDETLLVAGFDPIYFDDDRLTRHHLDRVSTTRPIFVFHASAHLATVNTAMLDRHGITRDTPTPGVSRGADGEPDGELQEAPAFALAGSGIVKLFEVLHSAEAIEAWGALARNAGVTTVTDLAGGALTNPDGQTQLLELVDHEFPSRIHQYHVPAPLGVGDADWAGAAAALAELQTHNTDMLATRGIKLVLDGSIQGWTAAMKWPGYFTGDDHGQLLMAPEQLLAASRPFHQHGVNIHTHCNGDLTIDLWIDTVEQLVLEHAWLDHRHTVQHCQLTSAAQYRRMARLGMCANIFANHIWFWGDQHHDQTVGPERARRMEACATAAREGVPFSLHSDASVTPLGQLHTMWCAVNRLTPSGRVLGEHERIDAATALHAVTLGAAFQQHMDHELGTIECGKHADFTVLGASPLEVDPVEIRDIPVWGTVVGGRLHPASGTA